MPELKRYLADGSTRAVWRDDLADRERRHGVAPVRASRIEVEPASGRFHVDFTPLAEAAGDDRWRCCLRETFLRYDEAVRREVAWLETEYVLGG